MKISIPVEEGDWAASVERLIRRCVEILKHFEISGTVIETLSSVKTDGVWGTEVGVSMDMHECTKEQICYRVWPALQEAYPSLECAHVHVLGSGYNGCVWDMMRPSVCPANVRALAAEAELKKQADASTVESEHLGCGV